MRLTRRPLVAVLLVLLTVTLAAQQAGTTYGTRFRFEATRCTASSGSGSPESVLSGSPCDLYVRSDASGTTPGLYVKLTGAATTTGWVAVLSSGAAGPTTATYLTQTADSTLTAEQALGALATGLLKSTTTTGVVSIAVANADFLAPGDAATSDRLLVSPVAKGTNQYDGTFTSSDLTAARTWTFPDATGTVALVGYGEMYAYENGTATTIAANNVYHAIQGIFSTGAALSGVTFMAGSTGPIASVAEGTPADGKVTVTDVAHGLTTGDLITIVGSTDYDGKYAITWLSADTFEITATWVATNTGTWIEGDYLTVTAAGVYALDWNVSADGVSATNENYHGELVKNVSDLDGSAAEALVSGGADVSALSGGTIVALAANDRIWLSVKQTTTGTDNVTLSHASVRIRRVGT